MKVEKEANVTIVTKSTIMKREREEIRLSNSDYCRIETSVVELPGWVPIVSMS
jgi:hypothetical protein